MRALILAGGKGTRLAPLTSIYNKHLVAVYDRPMIDYPIATLKSYGIEDILIVSGREHAGNFVEYLGDGSDYNLNFTYRVQKEAGGIAEALKLGKDFIGKEPTFAVILGDNIFGDIPNLSITEGKNAKVFLKKVNDAHRFGVATLNSSKEIESIIEKPKNIKKGYAVTGLYVYPNTVFDVISRIKPSARGEMEITDVNQYYVKVEALDYQILNGFWSDAGTPESLAKSTQWAIGEKEKQMRGLDK